MADTSNSGWFDDRFMEAYDLIDAIRLEHITVDDALPEMRALMLQIEKMDQELSDIARQRVS